MWKPVLGLIKEIKQSDKSGATTGALALAFVCMDTMAYLSLPAGKNKQGRADFIAWVNTYLICDAKQPYQYRGIDVYGARCALLHAFGSETEYHQKYRESKRFGYHDGGMHAFDPSKSEGIVMISTVSFLNDVVQAVSRFMQACNADEELRKRVANRLPHVLQIFPFKTE